MKTLRSLLEQNDEAIENAREYLLDKAREILVDVGDPKVSARQTVELLKDHLYHDTMTDSEEEQKVIDFALNDLDNALLDLVKDHRRIILAQKRMDEAEDVPNSRFARAYNNVVNSLAEYMRIHAEGTIAAVASDIPEYKNLSNENAVGVLTDMLTDQWEEEKEKIFQQALGRIDLKSVAKNERRRWIAKRRTL